MIKKIALFGGTFDPFHEGHIQVVQYAANKIGAEKVILIPAKRSPHKKSMPIASTEDRIKMISLAIAGKSNFEISDCEIKRPDPSYTLETIEYFRSKYPPDTKLYWLIGADSLKDFVKWYKIGNLMDICRICVMYRAGFEEPSFDKFIPVFGRAHVERLVESVIETPLIDISSTDIRGKIDAGQNVEKLVHPDVHQSIIENNLYK